MALRKAGSKETRKQIADKAAGAAQAAQEAKPKEEAKAQAQAAKRQERKSQPEMDGLRQQRDRAEANGKTGKLAKVKEKLGVTRRRLNEARDLRGRKPGADGRAGGVSAADEVAATARDGNGQGLSGFMGSGSDYTGDSAYRKRADGSRGGNIYARQDR